jgi:type III pantothenate kinase
MLLVADVGNTETTLGLCHGEVVTDHWRITTDAQRTPDEVLLVLRGLLKANNVPLEQVTASAIGSVVPGVTGALVEAAAKLTGNQPVVVMRAPSSASRSRSTNR